MNLYFQNGKFGCNQCSSFDSMKVSIFVMFGLKTPIQAANIVFMVI